VAEASAALVLAVRAAGHTCALNLDHVIEIMRSLPRHRCAPCYGHLSMYPGELVVMTRSSKAFSELGFSSYDWQRKRGQVSPKPKIKARA
jgi:hypothetical protein